MNANFGNVNVIVSERQAEKIWDKIEEIDGVDAAQQEKLDTIETGAEVNVQSDWDEATETDDDFIKNKPSALTTAEITEIIGGLS